MLAEIVDITFFVLILAIIGRALMSWFPVDPRNPIAEFLITVTEPILSPIRSVMPRIGMIDLTPMIAIILLSVVRQILVRGLAA